MKWNCNRIYGLLLMLVVCLSACNDDDADRTMNYTEKRCRIAVLCPEEWKDNWQEIAAWALENITEGLLIAVNRDIKFFSVSMFSSR